MATTPPSSSPESYAPGWLKQELATQKETFHKDYAFSIQQGKKLELWDETYPELKMRFNLSGTWGDSIPFRTEFHKFQQNVSRYDDSVKNLASTYGIEFERKGGVLHISHADYNLQYLHDLNSTQDPMQLLERVEHDAMNIWSEREDRYKALLARGAVAATSPKSNDNNIAVATITHEALPAPLSITLYGDLGRIDRNGDTAIREALATIERVHAPSPPPKPAPIAKAPAPYVPKPRQHPLPDEQKVTLIFDANIFDRDTMASERSGSNGRTWLDLLPVTAGLPTVEKILIPSHIADWELLGRVTRSTGNGTYETVQIDKTLKDTNHKYYEKTAAARKLLESASRWHIDDEGNAHFKEGKNPNIVIVESWQDREFANHILKIEDNHAIPRGQKWDQYDKIRAELRDAGEMLMLNVAKHLDVKTPVYFVSDDIKWQRTRNNRETTNHNKPIGQATSDGYVEAENFARAGELAHELEKKFGHPVGEVSADQYRKDVMKSRWNPEGQYPSGHRRSTPGIVKEGTQSIQGETLESIFKRGADILYNRSVAIAASAATHQGLQQQPHPPVKAPMPETGSEDLFAHGTNLLGTEAPAPVAAPVPFTQRVPRRRAKTAEVPPEALPPPAVQVHSTAPTGIDDAAATSAPKREKAPAMINITQKLRGFFTPKDITQQTALALKTNMRAQFATPKGDAFTFEEIAAASKLELQDISVIMGKGKILPAINVKDDTLQKADLKSWRTKGALLADALKALTNDDEKVATFKAMYKNFLKNVVEFKEMDRGKGAAV